MIEVNTIMFRIHNPFCRYIDFENNSPFIYEPTLFWKSDEKKICHRQWDKQHGIDMPPTSSIQCQVNSTWKCIIILGMDQSLTDYHIKGLNMSKLYHKSKHNTVVCCEIWGFHCSKDSSWGLLGCEAM